MNFCSTDLELKGREGMTREGALKDPNLTSRQIDRIRLNFATRFSERIPALICYSRFLTHLTFNCYEFFDGIGKFRISHSGGSQPNEEQT